MKLVFWRRLTNELLTTYLPTILLLGITYATTFFKAFYFEASLTVNLTVMLVMSTIFISVMEKLPSTSYVRMVDVWLIFCQLIPFIEVIVLTVKESYRTKKKQKINHHGRTREVLNVSCSIYFYHNPLLYNLSLQEDITKEPVVPIIPSSPQLVTPALSLDTSGSPGNGDGSSATRTESAATRSGSPEPFEAWGEEEEGDLADLSRTIKWIGEWVFMQNS